MFSRMILLLHHNHIPAKYEYEVYLVILTIIFHDFMKYMPQLLPQNEPLGFTSNTNPAANMCGANIQIETQHYEKFKPYRVTSTNNVYFKSLESNCLVSFIFTQNRQDTEI